MGTVGSGGAEHHGHYLAQPLLEEESVHQVRVWVFIVNLWIFKFSNDIFLTLGSLSQAPGLIMGSRLGAGQSCAGPRGPTALEEGYGDGGARPTKEDPEPRCPEASRAALHGP